MALYHVHVKNISRADGATALAASAYRAGARLVHDTTGQSWDYRRKQGIVFSRILLPEGAPDWMADRAQLWNAVEARERRKDARLAKEIEIALPRELGRSQQIELALAYADMLRAKGLVVDVAVHDPRQGHNPHAHLLVTTRAIVGAGFGGKLRELDNVAFVHEIRSRWTAYGNAALAAAGKAGDLDHRSYAARGIARIPQKHRLRRWTRERTRRRERLERRHQIAQYQQTVRRYDQPAAVITPMVMPARERAAPVIEERRATASPSRAPVDAASVSPLERTFMEPKDTPAGTQPMAEAGQGMRPADPRYPLLSVRPDWPPETNIPARDMSRPERLELLRFWQDKRTDELLREQRPEPTAELKRDNVREILKAERAQQEGRLPSRAEASRLGRDAEAAAFQARADKEILARWPELRAVRAEQERLAAVKHQPLISQDWQDNGFTHEYQAEPSLERRETPDPVPDPDGNPISPSQRDTAQERMLDAHDAPHRPELDTPRPENLSATEREEAQKRLQEDLEREERDEWEERRR